MLTPRLEISRDVNGTETDRRLRLQDIKTNDNYQGGGVGGQMLDEVERVGQQHGAREVYGNFSAESGKEAATRRWYEGHGFEFRPASGGGEEVYKPLTRPDTDADAVRRELRQIAMGATDDLARLILESHQLIREYETDLQTRS